MSGQSPEPLPEPIERDASTGAFEFVRQLATELSTGAIELPSFPDVALRVQKVLSNENVSVDRIVRVIGAEPMIATRVLTMANSVAMNPQGKPVTDLRAGVLRLGLDALRSAVIGFAVAQLRRANVFKGIERHLNALWHHSVLVAALSLSIARRSGKVNPDTAMLTGLVHGVGKLYILTRTANHPALFANQAMYQRIVRDWHANIAKALLESWCVADEIVEAVHCYEDEGRDVRGMTAVLADVLEVAQLVSQGKDSPDLMRERLVGRKSASRLGLEADAAKALLSESAVELAALRQALNGDTLASL
jgi:HD-like signal output (HDOD) protein